MYVHLNTDTKTTESTPFLKCLIKNNVWTLNVVYVQGSHKFLIFGVNLHKVGSDIGRCNN